MLERGLGEGADVGDGDGGAAVEGGAGLGGGDELLAGAGSGAPLQQLAHGGRARALGGPGRAQQGDDVRDHRSGHGDPADQGLMGGELGGGEHGGERRPGVGPERDDLPLGLLVGVAHGDLQGEAVELRLWQRVRALLLDRVLGREHVEGPRQRVRVPPRAHPRLLHRLQQRRLGLRRGAVDLVGEQEVAEHRARDEAKPPPSAARVLLEHLRAGDVRGHQVGRELHPRELQVERLREAADQQGLRQPGHADEQPVAAREQAHEQEVDHALLTDDAPVQLLDEALATARQRLQRGAVVRARRRRRR